VQKEGAEKEKKTQIDSRLESVSYVGNVFFFSFSFYLYVGVGYLFVEFYTPFTTLQML
jgi:hypothetical protein